MTPLAVDQDQRGPFAEAAKIDRDRADLEPGRPTVVAAAVGDR